MLYSLALLTLLYFQGRLFVIQDGISLGLYVLALLLALFYDSRKDSNKRLAFAERVILAGMAALSLRVQVFGTAISLAVFSLLRRRSLAEAVFATAHLAIAVYLARLLFSGLVVVLPAPIALIGGILVFYVASYLPDALFASLAHTDASFRHTVRNLFQERQGRWLLEIIASLLAVFTVYSGGVFLGLLLAAFIFLSNRVLADFATTQEEKSVAADAATHDLLTGLYNRAGLMAALGQLLEEVRQRQGTLSLILMDMNHFKEINDTYGHQSGDSALQVFASHIRFGVRPTDIVARLGGDEFVVVVPDLPYDMVVQRFAFLARCESRTFMTRQGLMPLPTASYGIAQYPYHGQASEELLAVADRLMYQYKQAQHASEAQAAH